MFFHALDWEQVLTSLPSGFPSLLVMKTLTTQTLAREAGVTMNIAALGLGKKVFREEPVPPV